MDHWHVRLLERDDRSDWETLFRGYAAFYQTDISAAIIETVWEWVIDPAHALECLVVSPRANETLVGLAHFRPCPRTLTGGLIGYLDDLFVDENARGKGAADALFNELHDLSLTRGWSAIRWVTQHFNERGRHFYDRYTGSPSDFIMYHWPIDERFRANAPNDSKAPEGASTYAEPRAPGDR